LWYTGLDPFTMKPVTIAKGLNDRKMQWANMQFFKLPRQSEAPGERGAETPSTGYRLGRRTL
jgi:hypothetical protein